MQWGLQSAALLSPMMVSTSTILGGILFVVAGIYQWTPLKYACLKHCRSPMAFIMGHWRPGRFGALRMGAGPRRLLPRLLRLRNGAPLRRRA